MNLVKGLHKYRWRYFDAPIIKDGTSVAWPKTWNDLKIQYGGEAYCLDKQVAVIMNDKFLGGYKDLKRLIETKYIYYLKPNYFAEAVNLFSGYIKSTGRPCAYFEIMIDDRYIGMLIFMLYSDLVPLTCENFLRLCKETKGGYSGTPIHRIVKDSWIQCGGYGLKSTDLCCENFIVPHDRRGVLGMANDGRHVDCSTQFFIALQPQDWMAYKYVAFGQLISGNHILKEIERVPVWYESPTKNVYIARAGILNLECQNLTVNKGTNKYLESHTENLVTIGELFYEALLEKVFLEVEFRALQRIQDEMITHESEITPEEAAKNIRTTARFMRKKEEIEKQIERSEASAKTTSAELIEKGENNDFDVEEYEYQPEEYSYQQATAAGSGSLVVPPDKPYYLPFTDVPFPGEVSSEYDLKRLLQGDYCFEDDIDLDAPGKKKVAGKKQVDEKRLFRAEVLEAMHNTHPPSECSYGSSLLSIDTFDERAIQKYMFDNADRVTFGGPQIKAMAARAKQDLFETLKTPHALIVDENLRQYRVAENNLKHGLEKKVSINLPQAAETHKEIIRRQTGFVRPEDLARLRQFERHSSDSEDSAELDDYLPYTRQVSIQHPQSLPNMKKMARLRKEAEAKEIKQDEENSSSDVSRAESDEKVQKRPPEKISVAVDEKIPVEKTKRESHGVGFKSESRLQASRGGEYGSRLGGFSDPTERKMSVLTRLIDEVDQGQGPTLKDYRPYSEQRKNKSVFLLTYSPEKYQNLKNLSDDSREVYLQRRHPVTVDSLPQPDDKADQILFLQHGKKVYRKISTDYVKTIDRMEQKEETSLRSLEYAKRRPAISVTDYQRKNKEYQENLARIMKPSTDSMAGKQPLW
ncbi:hypothetical protein PYW07_004481 [Mythimna separata]|uniref:PPIase cyclophilin-type domain-containing protein n=1 Tax=Mythimna separata TaxID=271217 RepID=A0AAD7YYE1_MYTSE|nr:hypothetical protein PYW07_004481 [Mythimna separata]